MYRMGIALVFTTALGTAGCATAGAATLSVGPDAEYKAPSAAIAAAHDGDTVLIAPGQYFDCAVVRANNLTIAGSGPGAVMTDKPCQGKAILVIGGNNVTIRNLTLQRARVPDGNGAGIRAEGGDLTVENSRFVNNENGILAAPNPKAVLRITGSEFVDNGKCEHACAHAIYVNSLALLRIEKSRFYETHVGHGIKSRALRTEIIGNEIADGPEGTSSYLIDVPNGGAVAIEGNRLEKGPHTSNHGVAISIGEEGVTQPTDAVTVRNNVFANDSGHTTVFVRNLTATAADLSGNRFSGSVRPLEGGGKVH